VDSSCAATCTGGTQYILCSGDADCPAGLPTCVPSTYLPGLRRCQ
jgi:hypothetical protein